MDNSKNPSKFEYSTQMITSSLARSESIFDTNINATRIKSKKTKGIIISPLKKPQRLLIKSKTYVEPTNMIPIKNKGFKSVTFADNLNKKLAEVIIVPSYKKFNRNHQIYDIQNQIGEEKEKCHCAIY